MKTFIFISNNMKNYVTFIKHFPFGLFVGTIANLICLIGDGYNKIFDNNIFNFLGGEIAILLIYLMLFLIVIHTHSKDK